jgi:hypothetical protein
VFTSSGHFVHIPDIWQYRAVEIWQEHVFDLLLDECKITLEVAASMRAWKHSGFSVDTSVKIAGGDNDGMQHLVEYIIRRRHKVPSRQHRRAARHSTTGYSTRTAHDKFLLLQDLSRSLRTVIDIFDTSGQTEPYSLTEDDSGKSGGLIQGDGTGGLMIFCQESCRHYLFGFVKSNYLSAKPSSGKSLA